jgi:hypothetical protein
MTVIGGGPLALPALGVSRAAVGAWLVTRNAMQLGGLQVDSDEIQCAPKTFTQHFILLEDTGETNQNRTEIYAENTVDTKPKPQAYGCWVRYGLKQWTPKSGSQKLPSENRNMALGNHPVGEYLIHLIFRNGCL